MDWTTDTQSSLYFNKKVGVSVVVGTTCFLAMIGSLFVILSYACLRDLRSQGRQILVNLSIMDCGIALGNVTGMLINFDQYYVSYNSTTGEYSYVQDVGKVINTICQTQAVICYFVTIASVLWTVSLAVYMFLLVFQNEQYARYYLPICYLISYGLATLLSVWILATKRVGYSPYNTAGWCGPVVNKPLPGGEIKTDYVLITVGYDLWIYLAIIVTATVYIAVFLRLRQFSDARQLVGSRKYWKNALNFLDFKLVLIPIAFILLRMWSCIVNILFTYIGINPDTLPSSISYTLIYLSGIGDSGQGFVNGLLFVFFTKEVFTRMFVHDGEALRRVCFSLQGQHNQGSVDENSSQGENSHLLGKSSNRGKKKRPFLAFSGSVTPISSSREE